MFALAPLLLLLAAGWTAYGAIQDQYDQDLLRGRICMVALLAGMSLPLFLPALALPMMLLVVAGFAGCIYFGRRISDY